MGSLITRRSLILTGVGAGALLSLGGWVMWPRAPAAGALILSRPELDLVERVSVLLFPAGIFPVHGGDGVTSTEVDRLLSDMVDPPARQGFRAVLRALEWGTFVSRGTRFTALSDADALEVLEVWASANPFPRRVAFESLKALVGLAFLRRPEVLELVGWRAGCFG